MSITINPAQQSWRGLNMKKPTCKPCHSRSTIVCFYYYAVTKQLDSLFSPLFQIQRTLGNSIKELFWKMVVVKYFPPQCQDTSAQLVWIWADGNIFFVDEGELYKLMKSIARTWQILEYEPVLRFINDLRGTYFCTLFSFVSHYFVNLQRNF